MGCLSGMGGLRSVQNNSPSTPISNCFQGYIHRWDARVTMSNFYSSAYVSLRQQEE